MPLPQPLTFRHLLLSFTAAPPLILPPTPGETLAPLALAGGGLILGGLVATSTAQEPRGTEGAAAGGGGGGGAEGPAAPLLDAAEGCGRAVGVSMAAEDTAPAQPAVRTRQVQLWRDAR